MNKYQELAYLKAQIKELTAKAKQIEIDLVEELGNVEGNKLQTDYATFSLYYRPQWEYTQELVKKEKLMKDQIKVLKQKEELEGKAIKISDQATLRVVLSKEDK